MTNITWSVEKNRALKADTDRNISFEDITAAIENGGLLDDIPNPNAAKFPHQRMFVVLFSDYVYGVPYVYDASGCMFLKTAFPSRALMMPKEPKVGSYIDDEEEDLIEAVESIGGASAEHSGHAETSGNRVHGACNDERRAGENLTAYSTIRFDAIEVTRTARWHSLSDTDQLDHSQICLELITPAPVPPPSIPPMGCLTA